MFLGHPGIEARDAAPPGLSQPSTPDSLTTPRHPPRALGGLTTPIGPPRPGKDAGLSAVSPGSHASRFLAMPRPGCSASASRDADAGPSAASNPKGSFSEFAASLRRETVCGVCHSPPFVASAPGPEGPVASALGKVRVNESRIASPASTPKGLGPITNRIRVSTNHRIVKESRPVGQGARLLGAPPRNRTEGEWGGGRRSRPA